MLLAYTHTTDAHMLTRVNICTQTHTYTGTGLHSVTDICPRAIFQWARVWAVQRDPPWRSEVSLLQCQPVCGHSTMGHDQPAQKPISLLQRGMYSDSMCQKPIASDHLCSVLSTMSVLKEWTIHPFPWRPTHYILNPAFTICTCCGGV